MSEMVERVAKALAAIEFGHCGGAEALANGKPYWQYRIREARAAIAAMREAPIEILMAGVEGSASVGDDGSSDCADSLQVERAWQAMIDEALKP